jgi:hypothetical protein
VSRPPTWRGDVVATLGHFAILTWAVDPARVRPFVHARFALDEYPGPDGAPRVWVSAVPFEDQDFRVLAAPWARFRMGQTNYRTYVVDRETGERAVWFWGTTLGHWTVAVPAGAWRLPWHHGRVAFDCAWDDDAGRYARYRMRTRSRWAPAAVDLEDTGAPVTALDGWPDLEDGMLALTHPLAGFYHRRDGALGSYSIWHDRLAPTVGRVRSARFGLLDRLGVVSYAEQAAPHSVLLQARTEFTVYLPPARVG